MSFEDFRVFLPKFLSEESTKKLQEHLEQFPNNIDSRIYTQKLKDKKVIFQGDGLRELLVINLPDSVIKLAPCMILSNTCDVDPNNPRFFPSTLVLFSNI
jgi:hypothetical protein